MSTKKYKQVRSISWLISVTLLVVSMLVMARAEQPQVLISPLSIAPKENVYKAPELAPLPERQANIAMIKRIWGKSANIGLAIAKAESGYRTNATNNNTNGTQDQGIFQINSVHKMPDMLNATANILYAYEMYKEQGNTPWNSSKAGWGGSL